MEKLSSCLVEFFQARSPRSISHLPVDRAYERYSGTNLEFLDGVVRHVYTALEEKPDVAERHNKMFKGISGICARIDDYFEQGAFPAESQRSLHTLVGLMLRVRACYRDLAQEAAGRSDSAYNGIYSEIANDIIIFVKGLEKVLESNFRLLLPTSVVGQQALAELPSSRGKVSSPTGWQERDQAQGAQPRLR